MADNDKLDQILREIADIKTILAGHTDALEAQTERLAVIEETQKMHSLRLDTHTAMLEEVLGILRIFNRKRA